jgi:hypothetical protein
MAPESGHQKSIGDHGHRAALMAPKGSSLLNSSVHIMEKMNLRLILEFPGWKKSPGELTPQGPCLESSFHFWQISKLHSPTSFISNFKHTSILTIWVSNQQLSCRTLNPFPPSSSELKLTNSCKTRRTTCSKPAPSPELSSGWVGDSNYLVYPLRLSYPRDFLLICLSPYVNWIS